MTDRELAAEALRRAEAEYRQAQEQHDGSDTARARLARAKENLRRAEELAQLVLVVAELGPPAKA